MAQKVNVIEVVRKIRDFVDWDVAKDVAADLFEAGHTEEEVVKELSDTLDAAIPFDTLLPTPAGALLELVDDTLFTMILRPLVKAMMNAEVRAAWMSKRKSVVSDRRSLRRVA